MAKKRFITESATTPTYGDFRRSKLDTVAASAKRIFLCEGFVQGRPGSGSCARQRFARKTTTHSTHSINHSPAVNDVAPSGQLPQLEGPLGDVPHRQQAQHRFPWQRLRVVVL